MIRRVGSERPPSQYYVPVIVLLSPSKTQDFEIEADLPSGVHGSKPRLLPNARLLMDSLRQLSDRERLRCLGVPSGRANAVAEALASWSGTGINGRPAAFAYTGETYRGLAIRSFEKHALDSASERLRILSALYGVLAPLDVIERYRLDFGCSLHVNGSRSLYQFWRGRITEALVRDITNSGSRAVLNVASSEFSRAIDLDALGVPVISPDFYQRNGTSLKRITVFSKQARGTMARWAVDRSANDPADLKEFCEDGYQFDPALSAPNAPVFVRDTPA